MVTFVGGADFLSSSTSSASAVTLQAAERSCRLEVLVGTYEQFLVGHRLVGGDHSDANETTAPLRLERSIAEHAHSASIRCMASHEHLVATGSADHIIKVLDLRQRQEIGLLMEHESTVTCVAFHCGAGGKLKLMSGDEEGRLLVSCVGSGWQCRSLGKHCAAITCLAVHPGGMLALSACNDRQLITWDLARARVAYRTRLEAVAGFVHWSPEGSTFVVGLVDRCDVYGVSEARVLHTITASPTVRKVVCAVYVSEYVILTGGESGHGVFTDISSVVKSDGSVRSSDEWRMFDSRVRTACFVKRSDGQRWLVAGSSSGCVKIWRCDPDMPLSQPQELTVCNVGCRITCMSVFNEVDDDCAEDLGDDEAISTAGESRSVEVDCDISEKLPASKARGQVVSADTSEENCFVAEPSAESKSLESKKQTPKSKRIKKQRRKGTTVDDTKAEDMESLVTSNFNKRKKIKNKNVKRPLPPKTEKNSPSNAKVVSFVKRVKVVTKKSGSFKSKHSAWGTNETKKSNHIVKNKTRMSFKSPSSGGSFHMKKKNISPNKVNLKKRKSDVT